MQSQLIAKATAAQEGIPCAAQQPGQSNAGGIVDILVDFKEKADTEFSNLRKDGKADAEADPSENALRLRKDPGKFPGQTLIVETGLCPFAPEESFGDHGEGLDAV